MNIRIYGKQYRFIDRFTTFNKFTFQTKLSKLEKLSDIRLPYEQSYKEGKSIEENRMAIENRKERFFSELSDYIAKVFGVGENVSNIINHIKILSKLTDK